eukprot:1927723-Alexandrium_andersonii.AAC.1
MQDLAGNAYTGFILLSLVIAIITKSQPPQLDRYCKVKPAQPMPAAAEGSSESEMINRLLQ